MHHVTAKNIIGKICFGIDLTVINFSALSKNPSFFIGGLYQLS